MEIVPERGEIWWVALDPTPGSEIRKTRPCVVVSVKVLNERRRTVIVVEFADTQPAEPDTDHLRWAGGRGERPNPRCGKGTPAQPAGRRS